METNPIRLGTGKSNRCRQQGFCLQLITWVPGVGVGGRLQDSIRRYAGNQLEKTIGQ